MKHATETERQRQRGERQQLADLTAKLRAVVKASGLSQRQVSVALATSEPRVSRLMHGDANPTVRTLERFARALGVELRIDFVSAEKRKPRWCPTCGSWDQASVIEPDEPSEDA